MLFGCIFRTLLLLVTLQVHLMEGVQKDSIWLHFQAPSVAGDAAAPLLLARLQSLYPRLLGEFQRGVQMLLEMGVAELGSDVDECAGIPPRPSSSCSKATAIAVRNMKKLGK